MRHQDDWDGKPLAQIRQFHLQAPARGAVHGAEGFIQQQHSRVARQSPRHGNALLLAAGKLSRAALLKPGKMHTRQKCGGAGGTLGGGQMAHGRHHIGERCHMRKQRVILKHQPHAAPMRWQVKRAACVEPCLAVADHMAAFRMMQPGNGAERGGFARTGRADDGEQLPRRAV